MKDVTLQEWAEHYHSNDEMRKTFRAQSEALKKTHEYGYYVTDFNLDQIILRQTEGNRRFVQFKQVAPIPKGKESEILLKNIQTESFLEIGLYSSMLSDVSIQFTPTFLKENFDRFSLFLPEEEFKYYKRVFVFDTMMYLCVYLDKTAEAQVSKLENELEKEERGRGKSYKKFTSAGQTLGEEEQSLPSIPDVPNQSAFVSLFILPFVIFALCLFIPLFSFLFGKLN